MTQPTLSLTQSEIDALKAAASRSSAQDKQNALASREAFLRWLTHWGLDFVANKIANWALTKIKNLCSSILR